MDVVNLNVERKPSVRDLEILIPFGLQFLAVLISAYLKSYDVAAGGFSSLGILLVIPLELIGFPVLGVVGLTFFFKKYKSYKNKLGIFFLLITSLLMLTIVLPSLFAVNVLAPLLYPIAESNLKKNIQANHGAFADHQEKTYTELTKFFESPQRVLEAKSETVRLESGEVVKIVDAPGPVTLFAAQGLDEPNRTFTEAYEEAQKMRDDFDIFLNKNLVGKEVKISLLPHDQFIDSYVGTPNLNIPWKIDGNKYGEIKGYVYLNGESISKKYIDYRLSLLKAK